MVKDKYIYFFLFQIEPALGTFNTPKLGDNTRTEVRVTPAEANGEIGFDSTLPLTVSTKNVRKGAIAGYRQITLSSRNTHFNTLKK